MKIRLLPSLLLMVVVSTYVRGSDTLIKNVVVYDGTGKKPFKADVRVRGDRITAIGKNLPTQPGEIVRDEHGLALAPGFIDMHSHQTAAVWKVTSVEAYWQASCD